MFSQQCILTSAVPAREVSVVSKLISKDGNIFTVMFLATAVHREKITCETHLTTIP